MFLNKRVLEKYDDLLSHPLRQRYETHNGCNVADLVGKYKLSYRQEIRAEWIPVLVLPFTIICVMIATYVMERMKMNQHQGSVLMLIAVALYLVLSNFGSRFIKKILLGPSAEGHALLEGFRLNLPTLPWSPTYHVSSELDFRSSLVYVCARILAQEESFRDLCKRPDNYLDQIVASGTELRNLQATWRNIQECAKKFGLSFNREAIFSEARRQMSGT